MQSPQEHLTSELDRLEFAHRAAFDRSTETANDLAMKHQQAEEKAISLRDDVLMESGEDPKTRLGRGMSDEHYHLDSAPANESNALTAENMEKFTQGEDRASQLRRESEALDEKEDEKRTRELFEVWLERELKKGQS